MVINGKKRTINLKIAGIMADNKNSFIIYTDWKQDFEFLTDAEAGKLIKHLLQFASDENPSLENEESFEGLYLAITEQIVYEWSKYNPKSGKYHWNYQGGISTDNHIIRNSTEMKIWRSKVFERDKFTCQLCNKKGGELNAHHIKKFSEFPELSFELSNGITLCKPCHINEHKRLKDECI